MTKDQNEYDNGVMTVLLDNFKNHRLPTAQALLEKVESGHTLNDSDMTFLKEVAKNIDEIKPLLDRHPECNMVATRMMNLCSQIAKKGLSNENI